MKTTKKREKTLGCNPNCTFFPRIDTHIEWEYDEKLFYKKRKTALNYICGYDGHTILNWTDICPLNKEKKDETNKNES